jgi:heme exporter protein C
VDAPLVIASPTGTGRSLHRFANPGQFLRLSGAVLPWISVAGVILTTIGLVWGLFFAPADWQQGDAVRIMYIHVPAAWLASAGYMGLAVCSVLSLVWRHPLSDTAARAAAPLGAIFTALGLVTGALWGKPMWGTYWVWDARLTSFLILLFLYLGYIALWNAIEDETRAARAAAILALVGAVDVVIVKYSVEWWSTLHQGESIFRMGGPLIASVFLWPLFAMMLGYGFLFAALWIVRIRTEILNRRSRSLLRAGA